MGAVTGNLLWADEMASSLFTYRPIIRSVCYPNFMQVTVNIPDELAAQIQSRGVTPQSYVEHLIAGQTAMGKGLRRTNSAWKSSRLRWMS